MSIKQQERTLDVWDRAVNLNDARIQDPVLCISTEPLSRAELSLIAGDAYILGALEEAVEATAQPYSSVLVHARGLDLARSLLQSDAIDGTGRIHWNLEISLMETLESLARLQLPCGVRVVGINHTDSGVVVTTVLTAGGALDAQSFRRGVEAGLAGTPDRTQAAQPSGNPSGHRETRAVQEKLLRTLQSMAPLIDGTLDCSRSHDGAAENELIQLQRKVDALDRKYKALATSRLGKLTLRRWARKRRPAISSKVQ